MPSVFTESFFLEEILPLLIPFIEHRLKVSLRYERQRFPDGHQFLSGFKLWFGSEIPFQNGFLVEMAHLDRNVRKHFSHAFSAIENDGLDGETVCFQSFPRFSVHVRILSGNKFPEKFPSECRRAKHQHTITARKERNVSNENEWLMVCRFLFKNNGIQVFLNRWNTPMAMSGQLGKRLLAPDIPLPKIQMSALWLVFVLELFSTPQTFVPLNSSSFSILFYLGRMADTMLFLVNILECLELRIRFLAPVCHRMEFSASQIFN